jgi:hypothetical protein
MDRKPPKPTDKSEAEPMEEPRKPHGDKINPNEPNQGGKRTPTTPEQQGGIAGP